MSAPEPVFGVDNTPIVTSENNPLDPDTVAELLRVREVARYYFTTPRQWADDDEQPIAVAGPEDDCAVIGVPAPSFEPQPPQLSVDPSLTAYAQLGALKLNCERSFISLIDHDRQYILAEATRSLSLEKNVHLEGDGLFIGSQVLPIHWGVCPSTIKTFTEVGSRFALSTTNITANRSRYIIRDFTKDDAFKSRPYVVAWPFMRFYAEVPMKNQAGFVIGSYCVVDNRPHARFGDDEVGVLQEIADTISGHLELMRMKLDYDRAERLMKGLSYFVEGHSTIKNTSKQSIRPSRSFVGSLQGATNTLDTVSFKVDSNKGEQEQERPPPVPLDGPPASSSSNSASMETSLSAVGSASSFTTVPHPQGSGHLTTPDHRSELNGDNAKSSPENQKIAEPADQEDQFNATSSNIHKTFQRACTLIRESMDLSGLVFHDAFHSGMPDRSSFVKERSQNLRNHTVGAASIMEHERWVAASRDSSAIDSDITSPDTSRSFGHLVVSGAEKSCEVLGFSQKTSESLLVGPPSMLVSLLRRLLKKYPQGYIFIREKASRFNDQASTMVRNPAIDAVLDPLAPPSRHDTGLFDPEELEALFSVFPRARSIVFYPIWDSHKSRWCAGCFGWTTDARRALQPAEVTYLAAFGNSVMAELQRLEAVATGKAKTDFISNISHELRSPLHGILASAELLQESSSGPAQDSMIEMVENCGRTLLDTMNHLLDYAKINNFSKSNTDDESSSKPHGDRHAQMGLVSNLDLRKLVEETVEVVHTGYNFQKRLIMNSADGKPTDASQMYATAKTEQNRCQENVQVILDIAKLSDWTFVTQAGAWRRIIMNLFGNALKYTAQGFIKISVRSNGTEDTGSEQTVVHFSITDTGKGISEDYLKHRLYTPFSQEDHLSVGAGLGLSIVQQIVQQMMGKIDIQSQVGSGTTISVSIPLERPRSTPATNIQPEYPELRKSLNGLTVCMVAMDSMPDIEETPTGILTQVARRKLVLRSSLAKCLTDWFGLRVVTASTIDLVTADIFLAEEDYITQLLESRSEGQPPSPLPLAPVVVLNRGTFAGLQIRFDQIDGLTYLAQPYGPSKISRALESCLRIRTASARRRSSQGPTPPTKPPLTPTTQHSQTDKADENVRSIASPSSLPDAAEAISPPDVRAHMPRVLLVDDNDINLKIMVIYMKKLNCSYAMASNGLQALEMYQKESAAKSPFGFVLMDLSMPVMDGITATHEIRNFEQSMKLPAAKIIALTGLASAKTRQEASAIGVDLFLTKPAPLKLIKEVIGIT